MRSLFVCVAATMGACVEDRHLAADTGAAPAETVIVVDNDGDSNNDGVEDVYQSFGFGTENGSEPYLVIFDNVGLPAVNSNLWLVGYGGGVYESDAANTWFDPWAPLVPYMVEDVRTGWAFRQMRDSLYQTVAVDATSFMAYGAAGWQDVGLGLTSWDDERYVVHHLDGANCPEGSRESTHYLWEVRDGIVLPLTQGIAPPDPTCL